MSDMESLRKKAEKRVKRRQDYYGHLVSYVTVNGFLWALWLITGAGFPWPIFSTLGWGIGLAFDTLDYFTNSPDKREDAIQREMAKLAAQEGYLKPKREQREQSARLSDDGEIIYDEDYEESERERRSTKRK